MKNLTIVSMLFALLSAFGGLAQPNMDVQMIRGLGNTCTWTDADAQLDPLYDATFRTPITGNSTQSITAHNIPFITGRRSTVLGHSMGGLVARSEFLQNDQFEHLISIGTPHIGAPIAEMAPNIGILAPQWIDDIMVGLCEDIIPNCSQALRNELVDLLAFAAINFVLQSATPIGETSTNEMIPSSAFMTNMNQNFLNSLPSPISENRFIVGVEDLQHHYRLAESINGCDQESGTIADVATALGIVYMIVAIYRHRDALQFYNDFLNSNSLHSLFWAQRLFGSSSAYLQGAYSLLSWQQAEWSTFIDGSRLASGDWWVSDGIVPAYSQVAAPFVNDPNVIVRAEECNHNEQTEHPNAITAIRQALVDLGIQ